MKFWININNQGTNFVFRGKKKSDKKCMCEVFRG